MQVEEVADIVIALKATVMNPMDAKALDLVVLILVTHPLPVMITIVVRNIIEKASTLLTSANAGAHLTLPVKMSNKIMESIDLDARRALVKIYSMTQEVMSAVHSDLSMDRRCRGLLVFRRNQVMMLKLALVAV